MKSKHIILILSLAVVVLVIVAVVGKMQGKFGKQQASKVVVEAVSPRNIIELVTASGKIYPEREVKISPDVSGEVVELLVQEGDTVRKGQLLARIRPDSYQAMVEQMDANLNNARANLANARARQKQVEAQLEGARLAFSRSQELFEKKTISKSEFESAETNYRILQSELEAAKESITAATYMVKGAEATKKESLNNLNKTTIYAPMDGIVSVMNVEKGEKVVGTLQMAGTEMMRIADFGDMEVRVDVSESEIGRVREGQYATVEVDAYPGRKFSGYVTKVASSSKGIGSFSGLSADQATNFVVNVRIDRNSYKELETLNNRPFRPGMSATVDIQTNYVENALTAAVQAVTTRDDTTGTTSEAWEVVFLVKGGKAELRRVRTGIQNDTYIHITEGVEDGEEVIVAPYGLLSKELEQGSPVQVVTKEALFGLENKKK